MPTEFDISNLQLWTVDGTPVNLGSFEHVETFTDDDASDVSENTITFSNSSEMTFTATCLNPIGFNKMMTRLMYGWRAKGPIRKRVIKRLACEWYKIPIDWIRWG